jgi:hypothetical protein
MQEFELRQQVHDSVEFRKVAFARFRVTRKLAAGAN